MKKLALVSVILCCTALTSVTLFAQQTNGAWKTTSGSEEEVLIVEDNYFACTKFDKANKQFLRSFGGTFVTTGNNVNIVIEFDTKDKEEVGKKMSTTFKIDGQSLSLDLGTAKTSWTRIDDGKGELAGNWRITGRLNNGQMNQMQRGDRKTLKILSGTRFQWMAINPATKEFLGTGGGTYTFANGTYTETIEFFSRDSSRVGATLSFSGKVEGGNTWNHSGKSSKGEELSEVWTREK